MERVLKKEYDQLFVGKTFFFTGCHVLFFTKRLFAKEQGVVDRLATSKVGNKMVGNKTATKAMVKVAAKKNLGGAVVRNKIKRRLRSMLAALQGEGVFPAMPNLLMLVVATRVTAHGEYKKERDMLKKALLKNRWKFRNL